MAPVMYFKITRMAIGQLIHLSISLKFQTWVEKTAHIKLNLGVIVIIKGQVQL